MEKYRTIAEAVLVLSLVIVGGLAAENLGPEAKRCVSRNLVIPSCDSIKPWGEGEKCFNAELGNKICPEPWEDLSNIIETETSEVQIIKVTANGGKYSCETNDGEVQSYTRCVKENNQEAYLGEIV